MLPPWQGQENHLFTMLSVVTSRLVHCDGISMVYLSAGKNIHQSHFFYWDSRIYTYVLVVAPAAKLSNVLKSALLLSPTQVGHSNKRKEKIRPHGTRKKQVISQAKLSLMRRKTRGEKYL